MLFGFIADRPFVLSTLIFCNLVLFSLPSAPLCGSIVRSVITGHEFPACRMQKHSLEGCIV